MSVPAIVSVESSRLRPCRKIAIACRADTARFGACGIWERRALWPRPTDSCCRPSPGAAVSTSRWRLWRCNSRCHLGMSIVTTLCIRMSLIQRLTSLLAGICLQSRKSRSSFHQGSRTRTSLARSACLSCLCRPLSYRTPLNILRRPNSMTSIALLVTSSILSLSLAAPRFNRARHPSAEAAAP